MNTPVATSYQPLYVAISYAISVLGAFVALNSAARIRQADGSISVGNTIAAGLALGGIGVWSMHFIGILALKLDVASSYAMAETLVSLFAAVAATALALGFVAQAPERLGRLLGAGFVLGMGVVLMHYLGMWGMKIAGYVRWDMAVVALSAAIAVVAATAALWLAFNTRGVVMRFAAALVMGVAVCAMHYTGMHAAEFICTSDPTVAPDRFGYVGEASLPFVVGLVAVVVAGLIAAYHTWQDSAVYDTEDFGASIR
ncbi:MHYT domain-containing protein [Ramlibacter sp. AN1133]|uniref:MHYT domain-containing protein n=1 Tax=Ramlibacter sp. AN1133 TaxID=3133429 RepID=UPI0030C23992